MIYFTADLHFNHDMEMVYKPRGFNSVEEMNEAIIQRWNEVVQATDTVYVLGDLGLGGGGEAALSSLKELIERLNGTITVIYGNHDTITRAAMYETCSNISVDNCYATVFKHQGYKFFLSHCPTICTNHDEDKPLKARVINLCGHTHTKDPFADWDKGLIYHVECDAHNCYPIPIVEIIKEVKEHLNEG